MPGILGRLTRSAAGGNDSLSVEAILALAGQGGDPSGVGGIGLPAQPAGGTFVGAAPGGMSATPTLDFRSNPAIPPSFEHGGLVTPGTGAPGGPAVAGLTPGGAGAPQIPLELMNQEAERMISENPEQFLQIKDAILQALQSGQLTAEDLNLAVQLATAAAQNPQLWPQLRQFAIQRGLAEPQELPEQYDEGLVFVILMAAKAAQVGANGPGTIPQSAGQPPINAVPGVPQAAGQAPRGAFATGGALPAESRNADGSIPITAHEGEFMIPKDVVLRKGTDFLNKLIGKDPDGKAPTTA